MAKIQANICFASGLQNTQNAQSDNASLAQEQNPILTPVYASSSSSISGTQQMAYLTKADFSATMSDN